MTIALSPKPLRVAIVGAGPGGLAATIQLSKLEDVELSVFDQARELREVGAVGVEAREICDSDLTWRFRASA